MRYTKHLAIGGDRWGMELKVGSGGGRERGRQGARV